MATITTLAGAASAGRTVGAVPYLVDVTVDFAAAATAKGSALAAAAGASAGLDAGADMACSEYGSLVALGSVLSGGSPSALPVTGSAGGSATASGASIGACGPPIAVRTPPGCSSTPATPAACSGSASRRPAMLRAAFDMA